MGVERSFIGRSAGSNRPRSAHLVLLAYALVSMGVAARRGEGQIQNKIWVSSALPGGVSRFDLNGAREDLPITPQGPLGIAIDASGNAWVAATGGGLWRIRPDGTPSGYFPIGGSPYQVAVDPEGHIWATTGASGRTLVKLSPDGELLLTVSDFDYPTGVASDSSGNVWVADTGRNQLVKISPDGSVRFVVNGSGCPVDLAVDREGACWAGALCSSRYVYRYSSTGDLIGKYSVYGEGIAGIAIDRLQRVWVANPYTDTVTVLKPDGGYLGYARVGRSPGGVAVDGEGNIWVANESSNTITKIGGEERTAISSYLTAPLPRTRGDMTGFALANVVVPSGDFDGDGWLNFEEIDAGTNPFAASSTPEGWMRGNVNARLGQPANVLYVNDQAGDSRRTVRLFPWDPVTIYVDAPPTATEPCGYALYALAGRPGRSAPVDQPLGIGRTAFATPLSGGWPRAVTVANNFFPPRRHKLGFPLLESDPSPSIAYRLPQGFEHPVRLTLQGLIVDPGSAGPGVSVTNVVFVEVR